VRLPVQGTGERVGELPRHCFTIPHELHLPIRGVSHANVIQSQFAQSEDTMSTFTVTVETRGTIDYDFEMDGFAQTFDTLELAHNYALTFGAFDTASTEAIADAIADDGYVTDDSENEFSGIQIPFGYDRLVISVEENLI
jgi:hypothetical protein